MAHVLDDWLLSAWRVAIHRPTATAVIADVHLGYSQARRDAGDAVPLQGVDNGMALLSCAQLHTGFRRLVVAGDMFEKAFTEEPYAAFVGLLDRLEVEWVGLVPGNHDRKLPGYVPLWEHGVHLGPWHICHGDGEPVPGKRVIGHWHPSVRRQGRKVACYLIKEDQLVLPAFSSDAAGADVDRDRRWEGYERWVIAGNRVTLAAQKNGPRNDRPRAGGKRPTVGRCWANYQ